MCLTTTSHSFLTSGALQVLKLMDMGFDKATVVKALDSSNGDEGAALELILSSQ